MLGLGVTALSVARTVSSQGGRFGSFAYWPTAAGIGALAWLLVMAGRRRSGQQRATLTGCGTGLVFGIADALTRRAVQIASADSFAAVLTSWPGYCLVAASLIGLWLMESSFNAAPLHASLPAITAAEPPGGIALGVVVFGDRVQVSAGMIVLQAAGLAAIVAGVIMVARAPALSSLRPAHLIRAHRAATRTAAASLTAGPEPHPARTNRIVGSGPPLVLIMGYGWTMESWDPRLVHALARHNRVVTFDNSGVGRTAALPPPLTIDAMADQTSALIDTLGLGRPDVLGWSMGGMIAQALAVLHPAQVRRLVLCATYPGTGAAVVPSQTARQASSDFPANQGNAVAAFKAAIAQYPAAPPASAGTKGDQGLAVSDWWTGTDAAGREIARISVPTLVADGTDDQLVPAANDHILARLIPRAHLVLYPDAGHAFLFQEPTRVASLIQSFLTGHPSS